MAVPSVTKDTPIAPQTTGRQEVAVILATRMGLLVAGIAIQSLLAYTLLPEGRGSYAVCVMFSSLVGVLFSPGADRATQYFVMTRQIRVSQGVSVALSICLVGSGLAIAVGIPLIHSSLAFFQKADTHSFYAALPLIPLTAFSTALQLQLAGLRCFAYLASFSVVQTVANLLGIVTLVFGFDLGVDGALLAVAASHLVMITLCLGKLHRDYGLAWDIPRRVRLAQVIRYGLKYYVARIGRRIDIQVGTLFLGMVASRQEVGLFAVASALMLRFLMISNAVASSLLPRVANGRHDRTDLIAFCVRLTCWTTAVAVAILLALSDPVIRWLFSDKFSTVVPLLWIIAPGIVMDAGASVLMTYFRGVNRPEVCSWAVWLGLSVNLLAVSLLYRGLGVTAAAWGMTIGMICRYALLVIVYYKTTHENLLASCLLRSADLRILWKSARYTVDRSDNGPSTDA